jgi:membrane protease YdiL (CAAX protease family)
MEIRSAVLLFSAVGAAGVALAWVAVRTKLASVWGAMGLVLGLLGIVSLASERVHFVDELSPIASALTGLAAGILLYVATWAFFGVAGNWGPLARHTDELYEQRHGVTLARALAVAALIVVPGEEFFWRGFVQGFAAGQLGAIGGALVAWAVYVAANAASGSVPVIIGVAVGGAVWAGLAVWPGGVLAAVVSHMAWTGLMILRRPG